MAAAQAQPQVHPGVADLQAVFTTVSARRDFANLIEMCAVHNWYGTACGSKRVFLKTCSLIPARYREQFWIGYIKALIHPPSTGIEVPVM